MAAHTLARCRVRLGPPRWALPPNAKLEHSWLLSSIFKCPDILNAVLTRTAPVPKGHLVGLERPGHCTATVLGVQPHAKSKHPRPVDGSGKDSIFLRSPNSAPSDFRHFLFCPSANECSPDLFRQTEITFPPRNCEIPVEGWDFF